MTDTRNEMLTRRQKDMADERIVGDFLDTNFYPTFCTSYTRNTTDIDKQYTGEDIWVITSTGDDLIIDEKAATQWANKNLQTFAIEISNRDRNGNLKYGWYTNPNETNDTYLFCWINSATTTQDKHLVEGGIEEMEVALVYKDDLRRYLESLGWTTQNLWKKETQIREKYRKDGNIDGINMGNEFINGVRFHFGCKFWEQSINVLIHKNTIKNISKMSCKVTNKGIGK